jgi:hypothetical protein
MAVSCYASGSSANMSAEYARGQAPVAVWIREISVQGQGGKTRFVIWCSARDGQDTACGSERRNPDIAGWGPRCQPSPGF